MSRFSLLLQPATDLSESFAMCFVISGVPAYRTCCVMFSGLSGQRYRALLDENNDFAVMVILGLGRCGTPASSPWDAGLLACRGALTAGRGQPVSFTILDSQFMV